MDEDSLRRKTIAELKALLTERNLKTVGKKDELIKRLLSGGEESDVAAANDNSSGMGRGTPAVHHSVDGENAKAPGKKAGAKVAVGGNTTATPVDSDKLPNAHDVTKDTSAKVHKDGSEGKHGSLVDDEKLAQRAKRFNITPDPEKLAQRAKRFNLEVSATDSKKSTVPKTDTRKTTVSKVNVRNSKKGLHNRDVVRKYNNRGDFRRRDGRNNFNRRDIRRRDDVRPSSNRPNGRSDNNKPARQQPTDPEHKKQRVDRRLKRKGVEAGVELDDEERARREKRAARFGIK
ncbi:sap domain-containing, putative [Babesia ovis]|uniref:Sap domain-containing, putative n=1 Tax=Babesia ovis TaxID=5869 RepID=A0A9W5TF92_BABOV|nr:sap domain-containing, putative [Babesia ovis]